MPHPQHRSITTHHSQPPTDLAIWALGSVGPLPAAAASALPTAAWHTPEFSPSLPERLQCLQHPRPAHSSLTKPHPHPDICSLAHIVQNTLSRPTAQQAAALHHHHPHLRHDASFSLGRWLCSLVGGVLPSGGCYCRFTPRSMPASALATTSDQTV